MPFLFVHEATRRALRACTKGVAGRVGGDGRWSGPGQQRGALNRLSVQRRGIAAIPVAPTRTGGIAMGYYVTFAFDPEVVDTPEKAYVELWAAGCEEDPRDAAEQATMLEMLAKAGDAKKGLFLTLDGCPFDIRFDWDGVEGR